MSADSAAMLAAVEGVTSDPHVEAAMLVGSYLESGWDPSAVGDGSYGPFQLQLNDGGYPGVSIAMAEDPTYAAGRMVGEYTAAAATVPAALWTSNPEEASEETAYHAETPEVDYYDGQGQGAVDTAWAQTRLVLVSAKGKKGSGDFWHRLIHDPLTPIDPAAGVAKDAAGAAKKAAEDAASAAANAAAGVVESAFKASFLSVAPIVLGVGTALGLIVLGVYKTASPGGSITQTVKSGAQTAGKVAEVAA
jgi:hypothetical protein